MFSPTIVKDASNSDSLFYDVKNGVNCSFLSNKISLKTLKIPKHEKQYGQNGSPKTKSQVGKKREVMWSHQMPMPNTKAPNTCCFTHLDEQTASVDETLMEALFTVETGKQKSKTKTEW